MSLMPKIEFLKEKIRGLGSTPAWAGQISCAPAESEEGPGRLVVRVTSSFVRDWFRESFLPTLADDLKDLPGEEVSVQIQVCPSAAPSPGKEPLSQQTQPPEIRDQFEKKIFHEALKRKYRFDNFVVGASNQFAHAAARAVSSLPVKNYNPLFLYGGVGLGKTHLLNAIGLESLQLNPRCRALYMTSEKFVNEVIYCIRFEKMNEFRRKYREGCDVLLIDDIQFIAGKERTQDEFFHTFNHLHDAQKQIILTSDKPPRDIPGLEERLRSRFEWGLIADIQAPDLETRVAILKKKAEDDRIPLDDEVAFFLASHIKSNVRELEGALIRLGAFASLSGVPITVPFAKDALKNVLGGIDRGPTVEQIQKIVSEYYRIKISDLVGRRRLRNLAVPRQIAMYLCRKHVKSSYPEIGNKFGGKDHSTVVHAFSKIQKILESDHPLRDQIQSIEQGIR